MDPAWLDQKFVFDVPGEAAGEEHRKYRIKVVVKAKSLVGPDTVLGKTNIDFSCLKEEKSIEGWFPLRSTRSSILSLALSTSGSIKLRLHWVHSITGYSNYLLNAVDM